MDIRVISMHKHHVKIRDLKGAAQDDLLTEIGKRLNAIAINTLHLEPPDEDQLNELLNILAGHYSDFSVDEFATAFEYRVIGKLKNFGAVVEHFNKFSPEYVSDVLNAFRRYRSGVMKELERAEELKKAKEQPLDMRTKDEMMSEGRASYETLDNFCRINKKLPLGWNWDHAYYWIKFGLKEVVMSDAEKKTFRDGVFQILRLEWLDRMKREKRDFKEPVSQAEFEPAEAEIVSAMKSIYTKNYFTKKYKLDVQQEILFNSPGEAVIKMPGAVKKKTNHNTGEQKVNGEG